MNEVSGFCEEKFTPIKTAFQENFNLGLECGASLAIMIDGEYVLDLWGGKKGPSTDEAWDKDTIVNAFSTTKIATTLVALILIDQGKINIESPVSKYWPEFAQKGKESITVKQILTHTSGVSGWNMKGDMTALYDWENSTQALAAQKPWWKPGTKCGYHLISYGHLLGEIIRRVDGRTIGQILKEDITKPLEIDFHIGLDDKHDDRVADLISSGNEISKIVKLLLRIFAPAVFKTYMNIDLSNGTELAKTRGFRSAEIPAGNGHGNARSLAKLGSILACGGKLDGISFLSSNMIKAAHTVQHDKKDMVLGENIKWGLGFGTDHRHILLGRNSFYWLGMGGSMCVMDPDENICIAYVMNLMRDDLFDDPRQARIMEAARKCF